MLTLLIALTPLLVVVGLCITTTIAARRQRKRDGYPKGITGWLVIPAISLVLGPFVWIAALPDYARVVSVVPSGHPLGYIAAAFIAMILGLVGFTAYTAVLFFMKKRNAPTMFIWLNVFSLVFVLVSIVVVSGFAGQSIPSGEDIGRFIGVSVGAVVWIAYMLKSERVENTFIK